MNATCDLLRLISMGCVCGRETVAIEDRRFFIKSRLGEGGFSYVDLVEDSSTHRLYALKRIVCHSREDEAIAMQEVDFMRQLQHPNLVALEAAAAVPWQDPSRSIISEVLIAMPFYRRGTIFGELEILAKKGDFMREARLLQLFRGICEGLKALHYHKPEPVAHRDMKPHNVLLAEDDTPVLMDFGSMGPARLEIRIGSEARKLQKEEMHLSTIRASYNNEDLAAERCSMPYRAPELFNVESHCTIDERIDIWSLGCTLYALCYKESPFDQAYCRGDSVALAVLAGNVKFPENSPYGGEIKDLINSMLKVNAMERPYIDWVIDQTEVLLGKQQNRI